MFGKIRSELRSISTELKMITAGVALVIEALEGGFRGGGDPDRLSKMEGRIEAVLGEVNAVLIQAGALKAAAAASEARERGHMKRAEAALEAVTGTEGGEAVDSFEASARAYAAVAAAGDDEEDGEVSPLPKSVESRREGLAAVRSKKRA